MLGVRRRAAQAMLTGARQTSRIGAARSQHQWWAASASIAGAHADGRRLGVRTIFSTDAQAEPWTVLGVERTASMEEVQRAWRKKAATTHPDRGGDPAEFLALQRAYERMKRTILADAQSADKRFEGEIDFKTFYFWDLLQEAKTRKHMTNTRVVGQMRQAVDTIQSIVQETHFNLDPLRQLTGSQGEGQGEEGIVEGPLVRIEGDTVSDQYNLGKILIDLMPAAVAKARAENEAWLKSNNIPANVTGIAMQPDQVFIYPEVVCRSIDGKIKKAAPKQQASVGWTSWLSGFFSSAPSVPVLTPQAGVDTLASQLVQAERASLKAFSHRLAHPPAPKQIPAAAEKEETSAEETPEEEKAGAKKAPPKPKTAEDAKKDVTKEEESATKPEETVDSKKDAAEEKPTEDEAKKDEKEEEPEDETDDKKREASKKKKEEDKKDSFFKQKMDAFKTSYITAALSVHSQSEYAKLVTQMTKELPFIFPEIRPEDLEKAVPENQRMMLFNYLLQPEVSKELIHLYKCYYAEMRRGDADEPVCEIGFRLAQLADWPVDKLDSTPYWSVNTEAKMPMGDINNPEYRLKWREDWILTPESLLSVDSLKRNLDQCIKASKHYRMVLRAVEKEVPCVSLYFPHKNPTFTPARWRRFVNELRKTKRMRKAIESNGLQVRMGNEYGCMTGGGLVVPWCFSEDAEYARISLPAAAGSIEAKKEATA